MISIEEIKQMIIKNETGWLQEIHGDDEAQMYVDGMKDEINSCEDIDDIADFYTSRGYGITEAYESIILVLRENTQVKE
jgi:hypothetical protein